MWPRITGHLVYGSYTECVWQLNFQNIKGMTPLIKDEHYDTPMLSFSATPIWAPSWK